MISRRDRPGAAILLRLVKEVAISGIEEVEEGRGIHRAGERGMALMNSLRLLALGMLGLVFSPALRAADGDVKALAGKIDERIAAAWGKGTTPAALADDAEFFRRVHLD